MAATSELGRLADPSYAIQLAVGPPMPTLVPQPPGSGLLLARQCGNAPRRFVLKKAHMSREDFRIFDALNGRPVAVMHHMGKNPYGGVDPLQLSKFAAAHNNRLGEWESVCTVSGMQGMPSLKIRPKTVSRHGRQNVYDAGSGALLFTIGKESKLKNMALRSNLAVRPGNSKDAVYRILPDLMGRTMQIINASNEQLVCHVQKSAKAMVMEAALGTGSELVIDVAPGVDWTAMVAIIMAVQQVGAHMLKDALGNYVLDPLKSQAVSGVLAGTGMQGAANSAGGNMDSALAFISQMQQLHRVLFA